MRLYCSTSLNTREILPATGKYFQNKISILLAAGNVYLAKQITKHHLTILHHSVWTALEHNTFACERNWFESKQCHDAHAMFVHDIRLELT